MNPFQATGLKLTFVDRRSFAIALLVGLAFGAYMALADTTIFAPAMQAARHLQMGDLPLLPRIVLTILNGAEMELILRLVCMTALVGLFVAAAGTRAAWCYWLAIALVTAIAYPIWDHLYFSGLTDTPRAYGRELALHFSANVLWSWLYWRRGFLAAFTAHCAAHLTLQPLVGLLA